VSVIVGVLSYGGFWRSLCQGVRLTPAVEGGFVLNELCSGGGSVLLSCDGQTDRRMDASTI